MLVHGSSHNIKRKNTPHSFSSYFYSDIYSCGRDLGFLLQTALLAFPVYSLWGKGGLTLEKFLLSRENFPLEKAALFTGWASAYSCPWHPPFLTAKQETELEKVTRIRINHRRDSTETLVKTAGRQLKPQSIRLLFDLTEHLCYLSHALVLLQDVSVRLLAGLETLQFTTAK